mgnify:CR=1 FL=1
MFWKSVNKSIALLGPFKFFLLLGLQIVSMAMEGVGLIGMSSLLVDEFVSGDLKNEDQVSPQLHFLSDYGWPLILTLLILSVVIRFLASFFAIYFAVKLERDLSTKIMKSMLGASYQYLSTSKAGSLESFILKEPGMIAGGIVAPVLSLGAAAIMIAGLAVVIGLKSLAVISSISLVVLGFSSLYLILIKKRMEAAARDRVWSQELKYATVSSALREIKLLALWDLSDFFTSKYSIAANRYKAAYLTTQVLNIAPRYFIELTIFLGVALVIFTRDFLEGDLFADNYSLIPIIFIAVLRIIPSVNTIITSLNSLKFYFPALQRLEAVEGLVVDLKEAKEDSSSSAAFGLKNQGLVVRRLVFRYEDGDKQFALRCPNLITSATGVVGIIGPSGSGKTTLVDVITGLYEADPDSELSFRGVEINSKSRGEIFSYVPQIPEVLPLTLAENIALGERDGLLDMARVRKALKDVNLDSEFGCELERVVDGSFSLSGGQAQRIAIARALYRDTPVIVLDESTGALDQESQEQIMSLIKNISKEKLIICIAHREEVFKIFDHTYFVSNGLVKGLVE